MVHVGEAAVEQIARLRAGIVRVEHDHAEVDAMTVAQFRAFVDAESNKYVRIIKETGVTAE